MRNNLKQSIMSVIIIILFTGVVIYIAHNSNTENATLALTQSSLNDYEQEQSSYYAPEITTEESSSINEQTTIEDSLESTSYEDNTIENEIVPVDEFDEEPSEEFDKEPVEETEPSTELVDSEVPSGSKVIHLGSFKAKGDGITDDTAELQKAIDKSEGGTLIFEPNKNYIISGPLLIHSNTTIDFQNSTLLRINNKARIANYTYKTSCNDKNIQIYNLNMKNQGYVRAQSIFFYGVEGLVMDRIYIYNDSAYTTGATGAWATYISGKNITITNITIDTYAGGKWADGLHFGYVEDLTLQYFNISSGDDCIAFCPAPRSYYPRGVLNKKSSNINISNGNCSSEMANLIRIGAMYDLSNEQNNAENNIVYQDVNISNISYSVKSDSTCKLFAFEDKRSTNYINGIHDNINIDNISVSGIFKVKTMTLFGAENTQSSKYNFGNITITNISMSEDTNEALLNGYGFNKLTFNNCKFIRDYTTPKQNRMFNIQNANSIVFNNCYFKDCSNDYTLVTTNVNEVQMNNSVLSGVSRSSSFNQYNIPNTDNAVITAPQSAFYKFK